MEWKLEEIIRVDDVYFVRGLLTDRGVEIMTIDMHKVKDGKIVETHHVEGEDAGGVFQRE